MVKAQDLRVNFPGFNTWFTINCATLKVTFCAFHFFIGIMGIIMALTHRVVAGACMRTHWVPLVVCSSLPPCGLLPSRLLCPWDSAGYHALP